MTEAHGDDLWASAVRHFEADVIEVLPVFLGAES